MPDHSDCSLKAGAKVRISKQKTKGKVIFLCFYFPLSSITLFLFDDSLLDENLLQGLDGTVNLLRGMGGHQCIAHQRVLRSTCGWNDRIDEHARLESQCCYQKGLLDIADIEGNDGTLGIANLKSLFAEALQGIVGDLPQGFDALWLLLQDMQCLEGCCRGCRSVGS